MTPYSPKIYTRPPFRRTPILITSTTYILNISADGGSDGAGILGVWDTADGGIFILVLEMKVVAH